MRASPWGSPTHTQRGEGDLPLFSLVGRRAGAIEWSMKFVDEAKLKVQAGNGGRGCVSFRREKFVPFGGPDGGDGGLGGSVYLKAVEGMNTLADFRISRTYKGQNGESGSGNDCTGHGGDDTYVPVPVGPVVSDRA